MTSRLISERENISHSVGAFHGFMCLELRIFTRNQPWCSPQLAEAQLVTCLSTEAQFLPRELPLPFQERRHHFARKRAIDKRKDIFLRRQFVRCFALSVHCFHGDSTSAISTDVSACRKPMQATHPNREPPNGPGMLTSWLNRNFPFLVSISPGLLARFHHFIRRPTCYEHAAPGGRSTRAVSESASDMSKLP